MAFWRTLPFADAGKPLVTVIEFYGVIGDMGAGRKGLTLKRLEKSIADAFKPKGLKAVALAINSPGGSPVQSRLLLSALRRAAKDKEVPVLAFIEDVGASGGYILALAGDEIYADESSIVGSIGVISGGFGFPEALKKIGVERRVHTSGENKSMLDPFRPEDPEDVARLESMLSDLHQQFIALVKERRAGKLGDDKELFSGRFWTGATALEKGLIDGIAQLDDFIRDRFGNDVKVKRLSPESGSWIKKMFSGGEAKFAPSLFEVDDLIAAAERRALWARFGL